MITIDYNPVWRSTSGWDETHGVDEDKEYDLDSSALELLTDMIGTPMTFAELARERSRTFAVKAIIGGTDYSSDAIVDFSIKRNVESAGEFTVGAAVVSEAVLRLRTTDIIAANAKVELYLAMMVDGEYASDWFQMGEFYVDQRKQNRDVWSFSLLDKLVYANTAYVSALSYPATMQAVWDEICTSLSYTDDASVVIDPTYMIQAGPAGFTKRQMMGYIAGANSACVYVGNDGTLKFRTFAADDTMDFTLSPSEYIRVVQTNPEKVYTRVVVTYDTEDNLTYEAGTGDDNHTLFIENPFMTQDMVNDLHDKLDQFRYVPVEIDAVGYPDIQLGDRVRYGTYVGTPTWEEADTAWEDTAYSWDGYTSGGATYALDLVFTFAGGLKMEVDAPSTSEQESEFEVDGTLTTEVKRLNERSVKFDKPYYGVIHSRTEGIVVEREDHLSKLTLNSDEMKWEVGGVDSLYYDALANKLKFKGDIIMEGGSISWSDVDAPDYSDIQGTKPPSDADNTTSTIGANRLTQIDPDGIYTGTLTTDQLIAGSALIGSALIDSIEASQIDVTSAKISSAQIDTITASQIDVSGGKITASQIEVSSLSALNANLGTVTAGFIVGLSISGGTITGSTLQTASSGQRIVTNTTGMRTYDSGGKKRLNISTDGGYGLAGMEYYDEAEAYKGVIFAGASEGLRIHGYVDLGLQAQTGTLTLEGSVGVLLPSNTYKSTILPGTMIVTQGQLDITNDNVDTKATKSASTSSNTVSDSHNHGLSSADWIQCYDSGGNPTSKKQWVPYAGSVAHSHTQT